MVIGACSRTGMGLLDVLRERHGVDSVIASDSFVRGGELANYVQIDTMCEDFLELVIRDLEVTQVYYLACLHSPDEDLNFEVAWNLNVQTLLSILKIAYKYKLKVFWPSSIAVFGPTSPRYNCPQTARTEPVMAVGISKRAGEYWCKYYFENFDVDVRSIRYPLIISPVPTPANEPSNYAEDLFHAALEDRVYNCYLDDSTCLPVIYHHDAVRAMVELMDTPAEKLTIRSSYNISAMSFAPCDLVAEIKKTIPGLKVEYIPDHRQANANSLPASIRDKEAKTDWQWEPVFDLSKMTSDMLKCLRPQKGVPASETINKNNAEASIS